MTPSIVRNAVRLDDDEARRRLLSNLPQSNVRNCLESGARFSGETWSSETRNDYWVVSDGSAAVCFTVSGLTQEQASSAHVLWDAIQQEYPGIELDTEGLVYIVREVTGSAVWAKAEE